MFFCSSEPLSLSEASLLAFRPALNAPVLNTDFLPIGPGRAAIVVFAEEYGRIGLAIGVRSNQGGQIAVFRNQVPIDASTNISAALEPALASAEQMGFLFDEDMVENAPTGEGRAQAAAFWGDLMGDFEMSALPVAAAATVRDRSDSAADSGITDPADFSLDGVGSPESPEIALDFDLEFDSDLDLEDEMLSIAAKPSPASAPQQLSRFQKPPAQPTPAPAQGEKPAAPPDATEPIAPEDRGPAELGRVPLVRVRSKGSKGVSFLARLLSSF